MPALHVLIVVHRPSLVLYSKQRGVVRMLCGEWKSWVSGEDVGSYMVCTRTVGMEYRTATKQQ
jgi:hypothetical protein